MRRVGFVIGQLGWGGAERQLFELASRIRERGFEPFVYCLSEIHHPYKELLERESIPVRSLLPWSHFDLRRVFTLRSALRRDRIEVVHAWLLNDNAYAAFALLGRSLPWIASLRSRPKDRDSFRRRIDKWAFSRSIRITANSSEVAEYLRCEYGCPDGKIVVIGNGIDPERLRATRTRAVVRRELDTPLDAPTLVFAGRLEPVKNIPFLLRVFDEFRTRCPEAILWLVGDGSQKNALREEIRRLSLETCVRMLGLRADVPDLLHAADLSVLCSHSEGLPNVVLESMGCGTPPAVTDSCGCRDIVVHGVTGWICPEESPSAFTETIELALSDPGILRKVGERALEAVTLKHAPGEMVRQTTQLYTQLLRSPQPALVS